MKQFFHNLFHTEKDIRGEERDNIIEKRDNTTYVVREGYSYYTPKSPNKVYRPTVPALEETITRAPIIKKTYREQKVVEVQPIIHRTIEVPHVHHIEHHVYEIVSHTGPNVITKEPIIHETIEPHFVNEVETIIHKEVAEPFIVHEEKHISEHIVRPTITTKVVTEETHLSTIPDKEPIRADALPHQTENASIKRTIPVINAENKQLNGQGEVVDDHPAAHFVTNEREPNSLDMRAEYSLERRADLQADSSGLPVTSHALSSSQ